MTQQESQLMSQAKRRSESYAICCENNNGQRPSQKGGDLIFKRQILWCTLHAVTMVAKEEFANL